MSWIAPCETDPLTETLAKRLGTEVRLNELQHSGEPNASIYQPAAGRRPSLQDTYAGAPYCIFALALVLLTGCVNTPPPAATPTVSEQAAVRQRLEAVFNAAETKDLSRLDSYHWYGPHFTKFSGTGPRQDAAAAQAAEHTGLSALTGLKLRAEDLQIDVFQGSAVTTFTMVATIPSADGAVTKREHGTLVFVKHEGAWKIVHEHFSAAK